MTRKCAHRGWGYTEATPTPQRIQLSRKKGFNLQAVSRKLNGLPAVNCDRPSEWGNPFPVNKNRSALQAVEAFKKTITPFRKLQIKSHLRGCNLACWCAPDAICHCDTLLIIANSLTLSQKGL